MQKKKNQEGGQHFFTPLYIWSMHEEALFLSLEKKKKKNSDFEKCNTVHYLDQ